MLPLIEYEYFDTLRAVFESGEDRPDRTGVGTRELYDVSLQSRPGDCFPRMTHRFFPFKSNRVETCWLLQGRNDIEYLHHYDVHIWDSWVDENGKLGPIYGVQLRRGVDQLKRIAFEIKTNPESRRLYWTLWNPDDLDKMALPPCHHSVQFYVHHPHTDEAELDMTLFLRSGDLLLGVPADIQIYSIIHRLMARWGGYRVGRFNVHIGCAHIYHNLFEAAEKILSREEEFYGWWYDHEPQPELVIREGTPIEPWLVNPDDLSTTGYESFTRLEIAHLVAV